jgi:Transport and Golgi organisation 2
MCTVVCRWRPDDPFPVQILALRDELVSRAFDQPSAWWPDQPDVIGGRDRQAGGSWCVSEIATGVSAIVLNRPERRAATPGAASRGTLPLVAVKHGRAWPDHVDVAGMASFNVVLAEPAGVGLWSFDGTRLTEATLPIGTSMITPVGRSTEIDDRFRDGQANTEDLEAPTAAVWADWLGVLAETAPGPDPAGLLVRRPVDGDRFETVFGQFIAARPGLLRLDFLVDPARRGRWTSRVWDSTVGS